MPARLIALLLAAALPLQAQHRRAVRPPAPPSAAEWLQQHAIRLAAVEPPSDDSDLLPLLPLVANARVVALGDATHGTHEFFSMKQRLVPFLIARAGFRVVAFEGPYEYEKLDDFVRTGDGDPADALRVNDYFFWDTQEILDLVYAIRAWNAAGNPSVDIAGIDGVHPNAATADVIAYLAPIDAAAAADADASYACVDEYWDATFMQDPTACVAPTKRVFDAMNANAAKYVAATSPGAFARALHAARVASQAAEGIASGRQTRDAAMAENAQWLAANAKVIILGHQTHFGRSPYFFNNPSGTKSAGGYLADAFGDAYVTLASTTLHGWTNAGVWSVSAYVPYAFPCDGTTSFASVLAAAGMPQIIVPFRQPLPPSLAGVQHLPIASSVAGGPHPDPVIDIVDDVSKAYDGILYIETTTPSRSLP